MRIRNIFICMLASMLCLGIFCPKAVEAAQTPQEFVKEFYERWSRKIGQPVKL